MDEHRWQRHEGKEQEKKDNSGKSIEEQRMSKEDWEYECRICGKEFVREKEMKEHEKNVHGVGIICEQCDEKFKSEEENKEHRKIVHEV